MRLNTNLFVETITRPFLGLTNFERLVQIIRFSSSFLSFVLSIVVYLAPYINPRTINMSQLNTYSREISQGIFEKLYNSVESYGANSNNGVGLTTSEIVILTTYTLSQIENVPQYIIFSLYGNCVADYIDSIDYSLVDSNDNDGDGNVLSQLWINATDSGLTFDCKNYGPNYIYDYKSILSTIGLDIIIDFAYSDDSQNSYERYISQLRTLKRNCIYLSYGVHFGEICIFAMTFWYYSIKGRSINPFTEKILVHIISSIALVNMINGLICNISLVIINYSIQKRIKSELQSFGFSYHLNKVWFTLLWIHTFLICVSCLAWSGFEWCLVSDIALEGDEINDNIIDNDGFVKTLDSELQLKNYQLSYESEEEAQSDGHDGDESDVDMIRDYLTDEEYELQSISLRSRSSTETLEGYSVKRFVVPSTMQF